MRAAKLKRKKETRAERAAVPAYADIVAARDTVLRQAVASRQVRAPRNAYRMLVPQHHCRAAGAGA